MADTSSSQESNSGGGAQCSRCFPFHTIDVISSAKAINLCAVSSSGEASRHIRSMRAKGSLSLAKLKLLQRSSKPLQVFECRLSECTCARAKTNATQAPATSSIATEYSLLLQNSFFNECGISVEVAMQHNKVKYIGEVMALSKSIGLLRVFNIPEGKLYCYSLMNTHYLPLNILFL
jgi:hypothetical protein